MAHSEAIKEYALDLYLEFNENGDRKHSFQDIADKIEQQHNEKISKTTIREWSINEHWDLLAQQIKNAGIEKAVNESKEKEKSIKDVKSDEISKLYKQNKAKNDLTGYLVIEVLKGIAEKVKDGALSIEDIPIDLRILEYINRTSFENMQKLDGNRDDDTMNELFKRLDDMAVELFTDVHTETT